MGMISKIRANKRYDFFHLLQILQLNALFLTLLSVTTPLALRALLGPLPFSVAFIAIEAFKVISIIEAIHFIRFIKDKVFKII